MFKKVMKGMFITTCVVIGAIGGAATGNDILESIATLRQMCNKDNDDETPVESAEEES